MCQRTTRRACGKATYRGCGRHVALTLRVASIGAVVHVFNMAIGFFGGMWIPVTLFPHGVEIFASSLPPPWAPKC